MNFQCNLLVKLPNFHNIFSLFFVLDSSDQKVPQKQLYFITKSYVSSKYSRHNFLTILFLQCLLSCSQAIRLSH